MNHLAVGAVSGDALLRGPRVRLLVRQVGTVRAVYYLARELRRLELWRGLVRGLALLGSFAAMILLGLAERKGGRR